MSYTSLGTNPPNAYIPIVVAPTETPHPYATMTVCDVQRHLIAAGKRISADGAWGPASKLAFSDWAKSRPLAEARTVMATGYNALPAFGTREDYKMDGQKIRIPAVYAMSLPPPAQVACGARAPSAVPPGTPPDASLPTVPDGGVTFSPGTGERVGMGAWPWVIAAAAVAAGGGYWLWLKRKKAAK